MRRSILGRLLTWIALALFLAAVVLALVIVWTANERVWYLDTAGMDATLDMSLTTAGRWVATAVLGALFALGLGALVFGSGRRVRAQDGAGAAMPLTGKTFTYVAERPAAVQADDEIAPTGAYRSTIVGDTEVRRSEESLPPMAGVRREDLAAMPAPIAPDPPGPAEPPDRDEDVTRRIAPPAPDDAGDADRTRIVFRRRAGDRREGAGSPPQR